MLVGIKRKQSLQTDEEDEEDDEGNLTPKKKLKKKRKCVDGLPKKSKSMKSKTESKERTGMTILKINISQLPYSFLFTVQTTNNIPL